MLWHYFHTTETFRVCKLGNKCKAQRCLLIHCCTQKIFLFLLQLDMINTTVCKVHQFKKNNHKAKVKTWGSIYPTVYRVLRIWREDFWISTFCGSSLTCSSRIFFFWIIIWGNNILMSAQQQSWVFWRFLKNSLLSHPRLSGSKHFQCTLLIQ